MGAVKRGSFTGVFFSRAAAIQASARNAIRACARNSLMK